MIQIRFDPSKLAGQDRTDWDAWEATARKATQEVIAAYEAWRPTKDQKKFTHEWDETIWKWLKEFMVEKVFHKKCAYCEVKEVRAPYHAEHFRPKGMVRFKVLDDTVLQRAMTSADVGVAIEHPGYFWLAYHWRNLLPSCAFCNAHEGKKNQFPTAVSRYVLTQRLSAVQLKALREAPYESPNRKGHYYLLPEDLDALESPMLVNPFVEDPRKHICFGDCGIEAPVAASVKGRHSIAVYNLDAAELRTERQRAQEEGDARFMAGKMNRRNAKAQERNQAGIDAMLDYRTGTEAYSAAVLDYVSMSQNVIFPERK
jgi:hypothetical protein